MEWKTDEIHPVNTGLTYLEFNEYLSVVCYSLLNDFRVDFNQINDNKIQKQIHDYFLWRMDAFDCAANIAEIISNPSLFKTKVVKSFPLEIKRIQSLNLNFLWRNKLSEVSFEAYVKPIITFQVDEESIFKRDHNEEIFIWMYDNEETIIDTAKKYIGSLYLQENQDIKHFFIQF